MSLRYVVLFLLGLSALFGVYTRSVLADGTVVTLNTIAQDGLDLDFSFTYEHAYELGEGLRDFYIEYSADEITWDDDFVYIPFGLNASSDATGTANGGHTNTTVLDGFYRVRVKDSLGNLVYSNNYQYPQPDPIDPSLYVAEYWNFADGESPDFDFSPEPDYTENNVDLTNLDWGEGSPDGTINSNGFVGRFTKTDTFNGSDVTFDFNTDDGIRVYIDEDLVIDHWVDAFTGSAVVPVTAGEHTLVIEYYENAGFAFIQFSYAQGLEGEGTEETPWRITECMTITESGYYVLDNNIEDVEGDCIIIEADDVDLDGDGYLITGVPTEEIQYQAISTEGYDRMTIHDFVLNGFYDGIQLWDSEGPTEIRNIESSNMIDDGIEGQGVTDITLEENTIFDVQDDGIDIGLYEEGEEPIQSSGVIISNNDISDTDGDGVEVTWSSDVTIAENILSSLGDDGIYTENLTETTISENTITDPVSDGIEIGYDDSDFPNTGFSIMNNTIENAGDSGIEIAYADDLTITDNIINALHTGIDANETTGIGFENNIISPGDESYYIIPESEYNFLELDIENADDTDGDDDDDSFNYILPFTFNFMGRNITSVEINSNGAIELLEEGEDCQICNDYGDYKDFIESDVIFSSFDDLNTYDGHVAVFSFDDEGGERIVIDFYGSTLADEDIDNLLHFQTTLYANGQIDWNFKEMNFEEHGYEMFTGVYDTETGNLYQAGKLISDEEQGFSGDFSGEGEFDLYEGLVENIGIALENVFDSSFINNNITAAKWVYNVDGENNVFNNSTTGNTYRLMTGAGAWTIFDITDSNNNGYADAGSDWPFNEEKLGEDYWEGDGQDEHPATENITRSQRKSGGVASAEYLKKRGIVLHNKNNRTPVVSPVIPTEKDCSLDQTLTQNLRAPSRNGFYNTYTKGVVTQAHILQGHLNRLGFNAGPTDGILGPLSDGAIKRMQASLGTLQDGMVGPLTRALLNTSCTE